MERIWTGLIPACLAALSLAWIVPRLDDVGVTWDEPMYFFSVERIQEWYGLLVENPREAVRDSTIRAAWDPPDARYSNPHPPAYKQVMAATEALAGEALGRVAGYRLAPALLFALLVAAVAATGQALAGPPAALGAGLALLAMPRLVGHAHIAATDSPLSALWFLAAIGLALHAKRGGRAIVVLSGVGLGLAMATKFTGWLLPVAVLPWCLVERRSRGVLAWLFTGLLVAWVVTPHSWAHPLGQLCSLFRESLSRESSLPIPTRYFGLAYVFTAPWHYPIVMTVVTVPLGVLALAGAGLVGFVRDKLAVCRVYDDRRALRASLTGMAILQVAFILALVALPQSPDHDGVRLFLPLFPFVALLAGLGLAALARLSVRRLPRRSGVALATCLGTVMLLPGLWQTARVAPFYLSYYNGLIGGLSGAAARGMEISYWFDSMTPDLLRDVERHVPAEEKIRGLPSSRHFVELQQLGLLRGDIRFEDRADSRYILVTKRMAYLSPRWLAAFESFRPLVSVQLDGVTLSALYDLAPAGESGPGSGEEGR